MKRLGEILHLARDLPVGDLYLPNEFAQVFVRRGVSTDFLNIASMSSRIPSRCSSVRPERAFSRICEISSGIFDTDWNATRISCSSASQPAIWAYGQFARRIATMSRQNASRRLWFRRVCSGYTGWSFACGAVWESMAGRSEIWIQKSPHWLKKSGKSVEVGGEPGVKPG